MGVIGPVVPEPVARRGKGWLTAGTVVNGVTAYLFVTIGTNALGTVDYNPVAVVWTSWTLIAAAVTVPVQNLVVVRRAGGWRFVTTEVLAALLATATVLGAVLLLVRDRLFTSSSPVHPVAVAVILVGAFVLGIDRGRHAASGDFRALGASLALEGVVRLVVLGPVLLLGGGADWVVVALLTGLAALLVPSTHPGPLPTQGVRADVRSAVLFGSGNALAVTVLAAGPLALQLLGAPSRVTAFFATVALLRAPYLLLTGVSPRLSDALLRERGHRRVRIAVVVLVGVAVTAVSGAAAVVVGPPIVETLFGDGTALDGPATGVLAAAHVVALATLVLSLVPVTIDRPEAVIRAWGVAAAVWLLGIVLVPASPVVAVAVATLVAEVVVAALLLPELGRWSRMPPLTPAVRDVAGPAAG